MEQARAIRIASIISDNSDNSRIKLTLQYNENQEHYEWIGEGCTDPCCTSGTVADACNNLRDTYRAPMWGLKANWLR